MPQPLPDTIIISPTVFSINEHIANIRRLLTNMQIGDTVSYYYFNACEDVTHHLVGMLRLSGYKATKFPPEDIVDNIVRMTIEWPLSVDG